LILLQNTHFLFFFFNFCFVLFFFMWNPHCVVEITKTT
jgi:hypothetical protein